MKKEFVLRGQTASFDAAAGVSGEEVLNFSGHKKGYAYKLTEFSLYPSTNIAGTNQELCGTITAGKTGLNPVDPNFNDDSLIATTSINGSGSSQRGYIFTVVNDTFMITQNLILKVQDVSGNGSPINWQCRFESVKLSGPEEAVANYRQFTISDG